MVRIVEHDPAYIPLDAPIVPKEYATTPCLVKRWSLTNSGRLHAAVHLDFGQPEVRPRILQQLELDTALLVVLPLKRTGRALSEFVLWVFVLHLRAGLDVVPGVCVL